MNAVCSIVGNVTADPELRYTQSGKPVGSFSVAVSSRVKQDDGTWADGDPNYYDVTCWGLLGESVAEALSKGTRVVVTGRLRQSSWEQDGKRRTKVEIVADDVGRSVLFEAHTSSAPVRDRAPVSVGATDEPF